ncbi:unnamed protein product [Symbiodinium necroappetens]|uniref:Uncharacterized protein n=1 Tax=Symbiodinium necroappetens TaxID=1628268 RepID=A0A812IV37_9DINO|nr:unnamed protein product [Symbiodinium necroappetens]
MAERRSRTFSSSEEWQQALQALNSPPQSRSAIYRPEQVFHHSERYSLGHAVKDMARAFRERHMETSLKKLRASPALIFLKVWHTYGIWVGACVYFTISANLMLAWYIDWYRTTGTYRTESRGASFIFHFDLAPFFAIFCRSWLLVRVVGDLLRFCYLLAKDAWEEDAFVTYRRVVCGDFQRDLRDEMERKPDRSSQWSVEMLSSPGCRALDVFLQISIYLALDVVPVACFLISYIEEQSFANATVAASAGLSGGSCIHVFVFFLAMWVTDVVAKRRGFMAAYRGEARLAPCEYPGESLQNFQWAGEFGDRHLANLEAARCVSFVEDSLDGPPDRCLSPRSSGGGGVSLGDRSDQSAPSSVVTSDVARRPGGSVHLASAGALDVQESSSSALPPRLDMLARPQRSETAGSTDRVAVADQLNLCIPMCVCFSGTLAAISTVQQASAFAGYSRLESRQTGKSNPRLHNVVIRNEPYYPIKGETYYQMTLQLGKVPDEIVGPLVAGTYDVGDGALVRLSTDQVVDPRTRDSFEWRHQDDLRLQVHGDLCRLNDIRCLKISADYDPWLDESLWTAQFSNRHRRIHSADNMYHKREEYQSDSYPDATEGAKVVQLDRRYSRVKDEFCATRSQVSFVRSLGIHFDGYPNLNETHFEPQSSLQRVELPLEEHRDIALAMVTDMGANAAHQRSILPFAFRICSGPWPRVVPERSVDSFSSLVKVAVMIVGWQERNWALVGAGVALMVGTVCRRQCTSGGPPTGERPCFPGAGSWELWALQAWGERYCGLHSEVQQSSNVTFAVVLLLQGILLATLGQWAGMLVCIGMVLVTFLRHRMAYRERPWGWLIGAFSDFALQTPLCISTVLSCSFLAMSATVTYPCILRSVTAPALKQTEPACTKPELAHQASTGVEAASHDEAAKGWQINTPSTICPTPRTPASPPPLALPASAVDIPASSLTSEDVRPFWMEMAEGDEGVAPFDEPLTGRLGHAPSCIDSGTEKAFSSLGLPDWVFDSCPQQRDDFSPSPRSIRDSSVASSPSSPALSCFETPPPPSMRPRSPQPKAQAAQAAQAQAPAHGRGRMSWADLAEEEEEEALHMPAAGRQPARARVSWADLEEDTVEVSWQWR